LDDDLREAPPVAEAGGLLGLPARARDDRDGDLDHARALTERFDQDLARPELVLLQHEPLEELGASGPVAAGRVGDPPTGQDRHDAGEEVDPEVAEQALKDDGNDDPRAVHAVGAPSYHP